MQANQTEQTTTDLVMRSVSTRLPDVLYKRLGKACIDADLSIQDALIAAVEQFLDRLESPATPEKQKTKAANKAA